MVVRRGTRFKIKATEGICALRVLRRHETENKWDCVVDAGPGFGSIQAFTRDEIIAASRRYGSWK